MSPDRQQTSQFTTSKNKTINDLKGRETSVTFFTLVDANSSSQSEHDFFDPFGDFVFNDDTVTIIIQ
jgi:hypothetical protein